MVYDRKRLKKADINSDDLLGPQNEAGRESEDSWPDL